jgi:hypothetical protein
LFVPQTLQKKLPFKLKEEVQKKIAADSRKHLGWTGDSLAVVRSEREEKVATLLERLNAIRRDRLEKKTVNNQKKIEEKEKRNKFIQDKR